MAACLAHFATEYNSRGERDEALEVLEEAYAILKSQKDNEIRDSISRFSVFKQIAIRFAVLEKAERAIEVALENVLQEERNSALEQIAKICILKGKDELGRQALNAIDDESVQISALISLSDEKKREAKTEEATAFLIEAETLCETIPQKKVQSEVYGKLIWRFFDFGQKEKERELLLLSLQAINRIKDETHKAVALANLAAVCNNLGIKPGEAEKNILRTMTRKPVW
jgi:tetratricopeptide (TPR) repeat protein